jgi:hypothetical protein
MLNFIKQQKLLLMMSVLILLVLLVIDPILNMDGESQNNFNQLPTLPNYSPEQVKKQVTDNNVIKNILAMFEVNDNDDKNAVINNNVKIMSNEQQQQQQGLLKQLYIGQKRYVLNAIISDRANGQPIDKSYQAILNVYDAEQNSTKSIYVRQGEAIAEYSIIELNKKSLYLQQDQRKIELRLFQPTEIK